MITVETERSRWMFDLDAKRYLRVPLNEAPDHPSMPYEGDWVEFTELYPDGRGAGWTVRRASDGHRIRFWPTTAPVSEPVFAHTDTVQAVSEPTRVEQC